MAEGVEDAAAIIVIARRKDIEEEAIFGDAGAAERRGRLWAVIAEMGGVERRKPVFVGNRRSPPQVANWWRSVWDAQECV